MTMSIRKMTAKLPFAAATASPRFNEVVPETAAHEFVGTAVIIPTYWGYLVRDTRPEELLAQLAQASGWVIGMLLMMSAFGVWLFPSAIAMESEMFGFRMAITTALFGGGLLMLWYASRGRRAEVQVDTSLAEVREVLRHKINRANLLGRFRFEDVGGVFIDRRSAGKGHTTVVMRVGNSHRLIYVAKGGEADMITLRDRIGRDLISAQMQRQMPRVAPRRPVSGQGRAVRAS